MDLSAPREVHSAQLTDRIDAAERVVDLYARPAFAHRHLTGPTARRAGFEPSTGTLTCTGREAYGSAPLHLIGETSNQVVEAPASRPASTGWPAHRRNSPSDGSCGASRTPWTRTGWGGRPIGAAADDTRSVTAHLLLPPW